MFNYPTGREGAIALNYDPERIAPLSDELLESFCGVGNPFIIKEIPTGSLVLDVGCGAGIDLIVAAALVGPGGRVVGVDLTAAMLERAGKNLDHLGLTTVETLEVSSESLPFADTIFDVIISNGVINLSPCKKMLFAEMYRVCKPGGSLQFADVILEGKLSGTAAAGVESWSQ